jgi:uncharacterized RDD family membrane protein YckC
MPNADTQVPPVLPVIVGPAPARLFRRGLALVLDTLLAGMAATVILTSIVYPQNYPDYERIMNAQWRATMDQIHQVMATGKVAEFTLSDEYLDLAGTTITTLFLVFLVYFAASEILTRGSTLGKKVFGLRAARWGTADPPLLLESVSRSIFKALSLVCFWPLLLAANIVPVLFRPTRRAGHDYLARTIVTGAPLPEPVRRPAGDDED